jgi:hypothetical protein
MDEKENIFDIRSNIDPVDNKPYVEVLKEDKDYKARFAAKNKKDFNVQFKKDNVEADLSKGPEGKNIRLKKDNLEAAFKNKKDFNVQLKKDNFEAGLSKGPGGKRRLRLVTTKEILKYRHLKDQKETALCFLILKH